MSTRRKIALVLYVLVALASLVVGANYCLHETFMPYHADALELRWEQVEANTQVLLLALMDVAGGGMLALFVLTMALVFIPFRRGERWARFIIPIGILFLYVPTLIATLNVWSGTPATPPWYGALAACAAAFIGLLLDRPWSEPREL